MQKGRQPLLYAVSSACSALLDIGVYYVLMLLLERELGDYAEPACLITARAISSFFNFNLNNKMVFQSEGLYRKSLVRYYCLAIPQMAAATLLLTLLVRLFQIEGADASTMVKALVDGVLFIISFFIQKFWVFSHGTNKKMDLNREEKGTKNDVRN